MTFLEKLDMAARLVEAELDTLLPQQTLMAEPMRYAVLNGGKRLRAFLVLESSALYGVGENRALKAAAAIEAIHAYSLVHDDLPCMDDDDLRRGLPTVHVKWDQATAVLVGDALQSYAFQILAEYSPALMASMADGTLAMVEGQAQDIAAEKTTLSLDEIIELQGNKTGALIRWSACAGPRLAGQNIQALDAYAKALGLAFQIQDDILDVSGDASSTGKRVGKDANAGKATFVSLLGLDGAKNKAQFLVAEAKQALAEFGPRGETLCQLADFIISRDK